MLALFEGGLGILGFCESDALSPLHASALAVELEMWAASLLLKMYHYFSVVQLVQC